MRSTKRPPSAFLALSGLLALLTLAAPHPGSAGEGTGGKEGGPLPTVAQKVAGLEKLSGLLDLYLDPAHGKVWLELPGPTGRRGEIGRYLYYEGLVTGLGSNPVGLDRGQISEGSVVAFRRVGGRILVEEENLRFRALTGDEAERRAVEESFASSVLWAGSVAAEGPGGSSLVDFTPFLVRDAHGVVAKLRTTGQGTFHLDADRSAADLEAARVFPDNVELESVLTYTSPTPGKLVKTILTTPGAVTLVEHQSFVRLPDDGYRPRAWDPRAGSFSVTVRDYSAPVDRPVEKRWIVRHRLRKKDPTAARSPAVEPLVYYVDRAAPEPVRSALREGASWWAEAFEKAGFEDAFRVEILPPGVDPLDVRYNVIQWVHRSTRGWSYGGGVMDPRTGEMIKGHVTLGSLRVRQDRLLFEGLAGVLHTGTGSADDPVVLSLARLRQLAAHEVGHTLGLAHNFAASTYGRASVMDYPAPHVGIEGQGCEDPEATPATLAGCRLDFSSAYAVGVGKWDVQAIRYAYTELPPGTDEAEALDRIARDGVEKGLVFLSDEDTNPPGSAEPLAATWDDGPEPVAGLEHSLAVRRIALARFGTGNLAPGRPRALLEEVLAPLYLHHRYELEAATKAVGGLLYTHAVNGEGAPPARPVDAAWQRRALEAVLSTLMPRELDLPEPLLGLLDPRPPGVPLHAELLPGAARPAFDPLSAAAAAAGLTVRGLLEPHRAARLVDFHRRDPQLPGLEEVEGRLVEVAFAATPADARRAELSRTVEAVVVAGLIDLAGDRGATPAVRARTEAALRRLGERLAKGGAEDRAEADQRAFLADEIHRFLDRGGPRAAPPRPAPGAPPGSPIGEALRGSVPPAPAGCSFGR